MFLGGGIETGVAERKERKQRVSVYMVSFHDSKEIGKVRCGALLCDRGVILMILTTKVVIFSKYYNFFLCHAEMTGGEARSLCFVWTTWLSMLWDGSFLL